MPDETMKTLRDAVKSPDPYAVFRWYQAHREDADVQDAIMNELRRLMFSMETRGK